jgi:hypothetical protein
MALQQTGNRLSGLRMRIERLNEVMCGKPLNEPIAKVNNLMNPNGIAPQRVLLRPCGSTPTQE